MQPSHLNTINRYEKFRLEARTIAKDNLPNYLKRLSLKGIDTRTIAAFRVWQQMPERKVDWDWNFASSYCRRYPKAFDLSIWNGNSLLCLTLGRPTYKGKSIRMDYIERVPQNCLFSGDMFSISQLAYEAYGNLIGAEFIRIIEPMNHKLIKHYTSKDGGFKLIAAHKGNPHYLVKKL